MTTTRHSLVTLLATLALLGSVGCGMDGIDSDMETEAEVEDTDDSNDGGDPSGGGSSGDPDVEDGDESVDVAVGASHGVSLEAQYQIQDYTFSNRELVTVHNGEEPPSGLVFECDAPGATDLTLEAGGDDGETTGEATVQISCREVTSVTFRPPGVPFLSAPLDRMPVVDRLVAVDADFRFPYDLYHDEDKLAGFGYNPFQRTDGVTAEIHPTGQPSQNHRRVTLTLDDDRENGSVETTTGRSLEVTRVDQTELDGLALHDLLPLDNRLTDGGTVKTDRTVLLALEPLYRNNPTVDGNCRIDTDTPDVCTVYVEDDGEDGSQCVFSLDFESTGTCKFTGRVDGTDVERQFSLEVVDKETDEN